MQPAYPLPSLRSSSPPSRCYRWLGRLAVASLHAELVCAPKPGLVTPFDRGAHDDMDAATFFRSLFALRGYFVAIAAAGARGVPFAELRALGLRAETDMLRATSGVNTHRGAIFSLGLLAAAAADLRASGHERPRAEDVCLRIAQRWRADLLSAPLNPDSHGQRAQARYQVRGVRAEAADGFPALHRIAVPALRDALGRGLGRDAVLAQTLMTLVAAIDDLNLLHRGGETGLAYARSQARAFLDSGGVFAPGWARRLERIARAFARRRLSPGGSADLLACAWFLHRQEGV